MISLQDRYRGSLVGLAAGDALGTTLEFQPPGSFEPILDMVGGGPFNLEPGEWTDDTSMALCLADSLISKKGFDPVDQLERYVKWSQEGYLSSNGRCFDIGNTVGAALATFRKTRKPFCGPDGRFTAGNGSVMRLAPVPLFFHGAKPEEAIFYCGESSRTTHQATAAIDACRYLGSMIIAALNGAAKSELYKASIFQKCWEKKPLCKEIADLATGKFMKKTAQAIRASGYVVESLEAALWAFYNTETFEQGCLKAVNLGNDSDTTGAIFGQLAGAFYGIHGIPARWKEQMAKSEIIIDFADRLAAHARSTL